jgi:hypothetical protein
MRRLRERQIVVLTRSDHDGRGRSCCVLGIGRSGAALYPIGDDRLRPGSPAVEHYLSFEFAGRPVALRGTVRAVSPTDLRFRPSDGIQLPRRGATRLTASAAFEIARAGDRVTTTTIDFSSDGALLQDPGLADVGDRVDFSFAPDGGDAIHGRADVVRREGSRVALAFHPLDEASRLRIVEHVVAAKRDELERDVKLAVAHPATPTWP